MKMALHTRKVVQPRRSLPRSLRLRLLLWYGSLLAVALGFFALLFLLLTTGAINNSVNSAVRTEARVAMLDVLDDLSAAPPYWRPGQLTLRVVDTYRDPGVVVEVLDTQSQVRYLSTNGTRIPLSNETASASLAGQPPVLYDTVVEVQHVRVDALPIRAPVHGVSGKTDGVLAAKVERRLVNAGSCLALATSTCMTRFIAEVSCPSKPSSSYSNPPVVDSPMIGGRLNGMTVAVRICCPSPNTFAISAWAEFAAPTRSANGFRVGTIKPVFGSLTLSMIENPTIAKMFWICGICF